MRTCGAFILTFALVYGSLHGASMSDQTEKVEKMRRFLVQIGEDKAFLSGAHRMVEILVSRGQMGEKMAAEIKKEVTAEKHLNRVAELGSEKLTSEELDQLLAWASDPQYKEMGRDVFELQAISEAAARLARIQELQMKYGEKWNAYLRVAVSPAGRKISAVRTEVDTIRLSSVSDALGAAQSQMNEKLRSGELK